MDADNKITENQSEGNPRIKPCTKRGQRRYEELLDTAARLFFQKGYAETSINEIVQQAGGSMTTAYKWFENKEGLFAAVFERAAEKVSQLICSVDLDCENVNQAMERLTESLYDSTRCLGDVDSRRSFFTECIGVSSFRSKAIRCLGRYLFEPFRDKLIDLEKRFGVKYTLGADQTAMTLVRYSRCMLIEYLFTTDEWNVWRSQAVRQTLNLLLALSQL